MFLSETGGYGENGVRYRLNVLLGKLQATFCHKGVIYFPPDPVGVDERTVQIKEYHK